MAKHLILCGGVAGSGDGETEVHRLYTDGDSANIPPRILDIANFMATDVPDLLTDLLEIASYVYGADSTISRGGRVLQGMGMDWRRDLRFRIPVREVDSWSSPPVTTALEEVLGFLSDDFYTFEFVPHPNPTDFGNYHGLPFDGGFSPDEVALFSGGLDSLAGAVEESVGLGKKVLLVSHHSSPKMFSRQKALAEALREGLPGRIMHLPVKVTKKGSRSHELTLRSRSFLFATLATIAARMSDRNRIRFYENGIVSLNFQLATQIVGARATRTTHPQTLSGFSRLFSALFEEEFVVENPFIWKTKADVVRVVADRGRGDLIREAVSCSHIYPMTRDKPHCGVCSQCIDRRFGTLGAGLTEQDPGELYRVRLLEDAREKNDDQTMAALYVTQALEVRRLTDQGFVTKYMNEISRVVAHLPGSQDEVVQRIIDLHRRQAKVVHTVLTEGVKEHAGALVDRTLPESSLLRIAPAENGHLELPTELPAANDLEDPPDQEDIDVTATTEIRLAVDDDEDSVYIAGLAPMGGTKTVSLIRLLVALHIRDRDSGTAPENFHWINAGALADELQMEEVSLRRNISRFRKAVFKAY